MPLTWRWVSFATALLLTGICSLLILGSYTPRQVAPGYLQTLAPGSRVIAAMSGRIETLYIRHGEFVRKGQLLAAVIREHTLNSGNNVERDYLSALARESDAVAEQLAIVDDLLESERMTLEENQRMTRAQLDVLASQVDTESQRLKLVGHLLEGQSGENGDLLIFDEPTTGLHFDDIRMLLDVFQRLVDAGNSLLVIEHNLDVIKTADHVIDLGPEGGVGGGELVAQGTPEEVAQVEASQTGRYLAALFAGEVASLRVAEEADNYKVVNLTTPLLSQKTYLTIYIPDLLWGGNTDVARGK